MQYPKKKILATNYSQPGLCSFSEKSRNIPTLKRYILYMISLSKYTNAFEKSIMF